MNDGSCIRLRPEYLGHVCTYEFVEARTHDGRKFRILTIIDESSRECLAQIVARQLKHEDVLAVRAELFIARGPPAHTKVGKWQRVHRHGGPAMARPIRREDALHRAGFAFGERL